MKLQAEMLKVIYKDEKFETIEKIEVIPRTDYYESYKKDMDLGIKNNSEIFISKNHFPFIDKENNRNRTLTALGFKIVDKDADNFSLYYTSKYNASDFNAFKIMECENNDKYFFDEPIINKNKGKIGNEIDEASVGYVNPGNFYIWVFENSLTNEEKRNAAKKQKPFRCFVLPSSMSVDTYKKMIDEIIAINRNLLLSEKNGKQSISILEEQKLFIDVIDEKLKELEFYLKKIENNPKIALISKAEKIPFNKIKKFTPKTMVEYAVNPKKLKFSSLIYTESFDIYEHRMIKYALLKLNDYIKKLGEKTKEKIEKQPQIMEDLEKELLNLAGKYFPKESKEEKINKLYELLQNKNEKIFFDLLMNSYKKIEDEKDNIIIELSINKKNGINSATGDYKIIYDKGCLCSEYEAQFVSTKPQLCRDKKYFIINKDESKQIIYFKSKTSSFSISINIELESNDLREHYKLYHILKERNINEEILIKAKVCPKYNSSDPLRGPKKSGNLYDYTLNIKKIESIKVRNKDNSNFYDINFYIDKCKLENMKKIFFQRIHERRYRNEEKFTNVDLVIEEINLLRRMQREHKKRKDKFNQNIKLIESKKVVEKIDSFLKMPFLKMCDNVNVLWKPTQIFNNDYRYNAVYRILNGIDKQYYYTNNYNNKEIINEKIVKLYEYWIFIKIVEMLIRQQKWELENLENYKKIIYSVLKSKNTKDTNNKSIVLNKNINVNNSKFLIKLEIRYDTEVYYDYNVNGRYKRPDFRFIITIEENGKEKCRKNFYFDAKYKDYNNMGASSFINEIVDVAIEKYIFRFNDNKECSSSASFIVHTDNDIKFTYWGGYAKEEIVNKLNVAKYNKRKEFLLPEHRYGAFCFLPGKTDNFITFMKLIMEYHFRDLELSIFNNSKQDKLYKVICWECGEFINIEDIKEIYMRCYNGVEIYKYHMSCPNCGHFWVKNHCAVHGHTLIKHVYHNYHESEDGLWYVKCPECDDTYILY